MGTLDEKLEILKGLQMNPNNISNWLPKIEGLGFNIPETVIIPLTVDNLDWLFSDNYKNEDIAKFTSEILEKIKETGFNTERELFIKTGNFSNKFNFKTCHLKDISQIGRQFFDVFHGGLCVGCDPSPEIAIREFIHTKYDRESIYSGMKLNTEFRAFYDFDNDKLLEIFNYWDRETMTTHLYDPSEKAAFLKSIDAIEQDFNALKPRLKAEIESKIKNNGFLGIWSIDFMWDGEKFWLIDMAIGEMSYYFDKLKLN